MKTRVRVLQRGTLTPERGAFHLMSWKIDSGPPCPPGASQGSVRGKDSAFPPVRGPPRPQGRAAPPAVPGGAGPGRQHLGIPNADSGTVGTTRCCPTFSDFRLYFAVIGETEQRVQSPGRPASAQALRARLAQRAAPSSQATDQVARQRGPTSTADVRVPSHTRGCCPLRPP